MGRGLAGGVLVVVGPCGGRLAGGGGLVGCRRDAGGGGLLGRSAGDPDELSVGPLLVPPGRPSLPVLPWVELVVPPREPVWVCLSASDCLVAENCLICPPG